MKTTENLREYAAEQKSAVIFCRINVNYWAPLINGACDSKTALDLREFLTNFQPGVYEVDRTQLAPHFPSEQFENARYFLLISDEYIAWRPYQALGWLSKSQNRSLQLSSVAYEVEAKVQRFHRQHLNIVRAILNDPDSSPTAIASAIRDYLFCTHFSVWFYSQFTRHFTLLCASFIAEKTFVSLDAPNSTLGTTLRAETSYTEKTVEPGKLHSKPLEQMRTAIRLRVDLHRKASVDAPVSSPSKQSLAFFCFYSPFQDFFLLPYQKSDLNLGGLTIVNAERTVFTERSTLLLDSVLESHQPDQLIPFLNNVCRSVTEKCGWEAASILLIDEQNQPSRLVLQAASGPTGPPLPFGKFYALTNKAKTVSAFLQNKLEYSYDLPSDPDNSHGIDDYTVNPPQNWIAVPIRRNKLPIGVLRAKNKLRGSSVVAFNDLDISILHDFAEVSAYVYGIETDAVAERRRQAEILQNKKAQLERETTHSKELQKTNEQLTDFITTFQHELRSPITIFTQIRERLERDLCFDELIQQGEPLPKHLREFCEDAESVADRFVFITDCMELHPSDIVQELRRCDCFRNVVAPILTFAVLYARNRSLELRCNKQSLFLPVFCDPMAASLALHTLIDNAIKYADPETVITIEGTPRADGCTIRVTNYGLPILPEEKERIFEKRERGAEAKRQKIRGAGIGLYLAREIMKRNNGAVTLVSSENPITFDLVISSLKTRK